VSDHERVHDDTFDDAGAVADYRPGDVGASALAAAGRAAERPPASGSSAVTPPLGYLFSVEKQPATRRLCFFWASVGQRVEEMMPVRMSAHTPDGEAVVYYGVVDVVHRSSSHRAVHAAVASSSHSAGKSPAARSESGVTWAEVRILRSEPSCYAPPVEDTAVYSVTGAEAAIAFGFGHMQRAIPVGALRTGARTTAGAACIDADYLFGANGAHVNICGMAGVAAKSSAMLTVVYMAMRHAQEARTARPSDPDNVTPVPVILSVKGYDLMFLDEPSRRFDPERHGPLWGEMGIAEPGPFAKARFLTPAERGSSATPRTSCGRPAEAYSWSLKDVLEQELFEFLFSDETNDKDTFQHLIASLGDLLLEVRNGRRVLRTGMISGMKAPTSFQDLLQFLDDCGKAGDGATILGGVYAQTLRSFRNRLQKILLQADGVLASGPQGSPPELRVTDEATGMPRPLVIDLHSCGGGRKGGEVQRFVVAALLKQMENERTAPGSDPSIRYLVCLDELHRFAPARAVDPVTKMIEYVAAEGRSLGLILIGAQQQASLVSSKVTENSATKLVGHTEYGELATPRFGFLSAALKELAATLDPGEMLLVLPGLRHPAAVQFPFPPWAMKRSDCAAGRVIGDGHGPELTRPPRGAVVAEIDFRPPSHRP
jgi:DNA helicase HerA-like ATPase